MNEGPKGQAAGRVVNIDDTNIRLTSDHTAPSAAAVLLSYLKLKVSKLIVIYPPGVYYSPSRLDVIHPLYLYLYPQCTSIKI